MGNYTSVTEFSVAGTIEVFTQNPWHNGLELYLHCIICIPTHYTLPSRSKLVHS